MCIFDVVHFDLCKFWPTLSGNPSPNEPRQTSETRKQQSPHTTTLVSTSLSADAVPHYLLLAAGGLLLAVLGLFGLWIGCFYFSGGPGRAAAAGKQAGGAASSFYLRADEDSLCAEETSVVMALSPDK